MFIDLLCACYLSLSCAGLSPPPERQASNFATTAWAEGPGLEAGVCRCQPDSVSIDMAEFRENMRLGRPFGVRGRYRPRPLVLATSLVCVFFFFRRH